jgi:hypothetical protein
MGLEAAGKTNNSNRSGNEQDTLPSLTNNFLIYVIVNNNTFHPNGYI